MRKFIGVLVVLFILFVMLVIFGLIRAIDEQYNIGAQIYGNYGGIGTFLFYCIYGALFIGITRWAVRTSWRKITSKEEL